MAILNVCRDKMGKEADVMAKQEVNAKKKDFDVKIKKEEERLAV